jgi:macrodomain Ter protein organizer (MatP/YcbG family)
MNEARKRREDSSVKKMKPEERTRFYQDLEARRKEFFAGESDSRKSFEAELRQKRSDYDSQSKDLRGRFDQEFRAYYQDYNQKKKQAAKSEAERLKAGGAPAGFTDEDMKDIQSLPKGSQSPLYPSDGDGQ